MELPKLSKIFSIETKTDIIGFVSGLLSMIPAMKLIDMFNVFVSTSLQLLLAFTIALVTGFAGKAGARLFEFLYRKIFKKDGNKDDDTSSS